MVKRRCLRLCSRRRPVPVRLAGLVFQGLVRASPLRFESLRTTPVMASPAFKDELSLLGSVYISSSAALTWARLSASSSSSGAPERKPAASVDACLSHFGECLTELASSYSLDGLVTLTVKKRLGEEFNLMSLVL
ncbi:hypothetical protein F2Q70_00008084 [Brassica cretica]|uniref:Uncharacterized protein n=2 Tax=Brassica cretica TaxID=69181 RepID=A0A8S9M3P7_BRACR|nr:hypothetical protein F2Q68_00001113 [Brassica cretica]KAF2611976.1 hypothetical protein F2Q70_00008084 [Brassica cretica]KAF3543422.1 hypothetical protein DY000_02001451 [Brassica cretica]